MTADEIFSYLCTFAPLETQMSFDNSGFLVGDRQAKVKKVLLALDVTGDVIDEAQTVGAQLIVSHHPLIFFPIKSLVRGDPTSDKLIRLIKADISVICMHTNLDIAEGGVNDVLLDKLGLHKLGYIDEEHCGRYGELEQEIPLEAFLKKCESALHVRGLRYVGSRNVKRVAVLGGAGADEVRFAADKGCDTFVTADVKYHDFLDAEERGLNLIDADHFCTENPVIPALRDKLAAAFPQVEFTISKRHQQRINSL